MEFLNHCELLKIEDILPFFQDFVTIDHFKVSGSSLLTLSQLASNPMFNGLDEPVYEKISPCFGRKSFKFSTTTSQFSLSECWNLRRSKEF